MKCIVNGKLVLTDGILQGNLLIDQGRIREITQAAPVGEVIDAKGAYVAPGFIDVHTHGRGGSDVMYPTLKDLDTISRATLKTGVTGFLPTPMTMPVEDLARAVENIAANRHRVAGAKILGIHLEGPFFNRRYKGAQPEECLLPPTVEHYESFVKGHGACIKKISLAPELEHGLDFIRYAAAQGIVVSLGHTGATYEQAQAAIDAGATSTTHTFNAMTPLAHRAPGVVGAAMINDSVYSELILDGIHVEYAAAKALLRAKGSDKVILVTDSMEAAGLPDGKYRIGTQDVFVQNHRATLADGTLAGSVAAMNDLVRNAYRQLELPLHEAVKLASHNPAVSIGETELGQIKAGNLADLVFFDDDIQIEGVMLNGEMRL